jgi:hypothetical protein
MHLYDGSGGGTYPSPIQVYAGLLLSHWNENSVTYNTRPSSLLTDAYGNPLASATVSPNSSQKIPSLNFDVTKIVSKWYNNQNPNYGFVLLMSNNAPDGRWSFYSRDGFQPGSAGLEIDYTW